MIVCNLVFHVCLLRVLLYLNVVVGDVSCKELENILLALACVNEFHISLVLFLLFKVTRYQSRVCLNIDVGRYRGLLFWEIISGVSSSSGGFMRYVNRGFCFAVSLLRDNRPRNPFMEVLLFVPVAVFAHLCY